MTQTRLLLLGVIASFRDVPGSELYGLSPKAANARLGEINAAYASDVLLAGLVNEYAAMCGRSPVFVF